MLTFGGILFWCLIALIFFIVLVSHEWDDEAQFGWPITTLLIGGIVMYFCYKSDWNNVLTELNFRKLLIFSIIWLVIGLAWSFFKWFKFVRKKYKKFKESYPAKVDVEDVKYRYIPKVSDNKEQITTWIVFWPFSVIRYALESLLKDFFNGIIKMFTGWYDRITISQFK